jgi:hypothetical protein
MSKATEQNMRDFLGDTGEIPAAQLTAALEMAYETVLQDGIAESHEAFSSLQMLYAAHVLEVSGVVGGSIASKSIGDVSVSFGGTKNVSFETLYNRLKSQIIGLGGRII